jgi:hypothetical protein
LCGELGEPIAKPASLLEGRFFLSAFKCRELSFFIRRFIMHRQEGIIGSYFGVPGFYLLLEDGNRSSGVRASNANTVCASNDRYPVCISEPASLKPVLFS